MKGDDGKLFKLFQFRRQPVAFRPRLAQHFPNFDEFVRAVGDRHDKPFDLGDGFAVTLLQPFAIARQFLRPPGMFQMIFPDVNFDQVRVQHVLLKPMKDAGFHLPGRYGPIVAARRRTAFTVTGTAPAFGPDDRPRTVTDATAHDPGQHVLRPARLFGAARLDHAQHVLNRVPVFVTDDLQFRDVFDQPFAFRVWADQRLAGLRIDDLAGPVEDQFADIELVLQYAVLPLPVPVKGGRAPETVAPGSRLGGWHAFRVQSIRDLAGTDARRIFAEDTPHDFSLIVVNFPQAPDQLAAFVQSVRFAIAIGNSGGGTLLRYGPALSALHLRAQVFPELGVHKPAKCGGYIGNFAVGQGEQPRARERDPFADREGVALVTCNPVRRFSQDLIDAARFDARQQGVQPRPVVFADTRRAADREISEDVQDFPAFAVAPFAA